MLNSSWPSDAIWRHRSGSTFTQSMACCLTAPSHYLNQYWLITSEVMWHSPGTISQEMLQISTLNMSLKINSIYSYAFDCLLMSVASYLVIIIRCHPSSPIDGWVVSWWANHNERCTPSLKCIDNLSWYFMVASFFKLLLIAEHFHSNELHCTETLSINFRDQCAWHNIDMTK